jgi:hypothetical protein
VGWVGEEFGVVRSLALERQQPHAPELRWSGLNLEYGASAVFPCGQSQRSIGTATLPH